MFRVLILWVFFTASSCFAIEVQLYPSVLYVKELTTLTFKVKGVPADSKLSLFETTAEGEPVRYIGTVLDEGFGGDRKAKDGWFSRTFKVLEIEPRRTYYAAFDERSNPPTRLPETQLDVDIRIRPSFIESVLQIWNRVVHPSHDEAIETPPEAKEPPPVRVEPTERPSPSGMD